MTAKIGCGRTADTATTHRPSVEKNSPATAVCWPEGSVGQLSPGGDDDPQKNFDHRNPPPK
jgi:hypothetical protein